MSNRTTFEVVREGNKKFSTVWDDKEFSASSPLALDQKLDRADAPRPRIFKISDKA